MASEQLMLGDGPRYYQMQSDPLTSRTSSAVSSTESTRIFDELPKATIVSVSRPDAGDISPVLLSYTIEFRYKQASSLSKLTSIFKWRLIKKASQVFYLHFALKRRLFIEEIHEKQEQVKEWLQNLGIGEHSPVVQDDDEQDDDALPLHQDDSTKKRDVPSSAALPVIRPALGRQSSVSDRGKVAMHEYLNHFLGNMDIVNSPEVCKFLEASKLSFSSEYGPKLKEDYVMVKHLPKLAKNDDDSDRCCACHWFNCCNDNWQKVWAVLKPGFLALLADPLDTKPLDIIVFDVLPALAGNTEGRASLAVEVKERNPLRHAFKVTCGIRSIRLRTKSSAKAKDWVAAINDAGLRPPEGWCHPHRFGSFAPPRGLTEDGSQAQWFVDGRAAFDAIASSIENAKSEIFICGWWLCPELYLRRPFPEQASSRLDALLEAKAKQGVQPLYLVVHLLNMYSSFFHLLLFVRGGRIVGCPQRQVESSFRRRPPNYEMPSVGLDPTTPRYILLYKELALALKINSVYSKRKLLSIRECEGIALSGSLLYWSHHEKLVIVDYQICFIGGLDLCFGRYDTFEHKVVIILPQYGPEKTTNPSGYLLLLKVSTTCKESEPNSWEDMVKDELDREKYPRMPWHDVHCALWGPPCRDIATSFCSAVELCQEAKELDNCSVFSKSNGLDTTASKSLSFAFRKSKIEPAVADTPMKGFVDVMPVSGVSSVVCWNQPIEESIHCAYCSLIEKAEHFVYIENQFFISGLSGDEIIRNRVLEALYRRIMRAYNENKCFRVIIVIPLLPGFQGGVDDAGAASVRAIMHWQAHGKLFDGGPVATSPVYVHSKVMIIDDCAALIGSANINDRSLLGSRDSEIGVLLEDKEFVDSWMGGKHGRPGNLPLKHKEFVDSWMGGKHWKAGKFALSLRLSLWSEHLVFVEERFINQIMDPITDSSYKDIWVGTAKMNTTIYQDVFSCVPNDLIHSRLALRQSSAFWKERLGHTTIDLGIAPAKLESYQNGEMKQVDPVEGLKSVRGHLVLSPWIS
ncbi:Phospholipase D p1 [Hibiscus syriacus]|uniref:Phospholipase n=1 Tax=Hibiscus syriacus TaxID=106335 RepID=A0A6A2XZ91_HIBSY|nr:Phospholipase D p1 [Hibiscus syriacus]